MVKRRDDQPTGPLSVLVGFGLVLGVVVPVALGSVLIGSVMTPIAIGCAVVTFTPITFKGRGLELDRLVVMAETFFVYAFGLGAILAAI